VTQRPVRGVERHCASLLLAHPLGLPSRFEFFDVLGRKLRPVNGKGDLADLAGECKWRRVVLIADPRQHVRADVEGLVKLQDERNAALDLLGGDFFAIHL
jgi:hypothetical protein